MNAKSRLRQPSARSVSVSTTFLLFLLAACQPTPPPANTNLPAPSCAPIYASNGEGLALIRLPDGTEFQLYGPTEVEISMAGCASGLTRHQVLVRRGEVAGKSAAGAPPFVLAGPVGFYGQSGGVAAASFVPESGVFRLDCVSGPCELGPDAQNLTPLASGEGGEMDSNGSLNVPTAIDTATLHAHFGDWLGIAAPPTASPSATYTPDLAATATSGCATFESEFPSTPCP